MPLSYNEFEKDVLYIDSRERDRGYRFEDYIYERIKTEKGQDYLVVDQKKQPINGIKRCALLVGDYAFNDILFEYKTVEDFWKSNLNNHMIEQILDLIKIYEYTKSVEPNLIIQGDRQGYFVEKDRTKGIHRTNYNNLADYENSTFSIGEWLPTFQATREEQAFYMMAKRFAESGIMRGPTSRFLSKAMDFTSKMIYVSTPLTWKQSVNVKQHFNLTNPSQILHLTIKELMQVRGIGEKSAREAYNMLHGLPLNRD